MPAKIPLLNKRHILAIIAVILVAGLIGFSPTIYERVINLAPLSGQVDTLQSASDEKASGPYYYHLPVISMGSLYYLPSISLGNKSYVQDGAPVYIPNFNHPVAGCNWAGVAGQVFGSDGNPVSGYTVVISGSINGKSVSLNGVTGRAQAYGIGGYEIQLSGAPFSSSGKLSAYVFDTNLRQLSAKIPITTYKDCQANLLLLNFANSY